MNWPQVRVSWAAILELTGWTCIEFNIAFSCPLDFQHMNHCLFDKDFNNYKPINIWIFHIVYQKAPLKVMALIVSYLIFVYAAPTSIRLQSHSMFAVNFATCICLSYILFYSSYSVTVFWCTLENPLHTKS